MNTKTLFMLLALSGALVNAQTVAAAGDHDDKHDDHSGEHKSHGDHDEGEESHGSHAGHDEGEASHGSHGDHDEGEESHGGHDEGEESHGGHDDHDEEEESHGGHGGGHGGHGGHDEHGEEGVTKLTPTQMKAANIVVKALQPQLINSAIKAPGEVRFNTYKTASITPRITAQVIDRHVVLGEVVKKGQPIVTLSSVEMAEAQGDLLVVDREWKRVKKLGKKVVSARRYTEAKVKWELAKAKVKAYGMTTRQIESLIASEDFSRANGRFELVATSAGTVLKENYILGQQAEAGQELIRITDESSLWVIANVAPVIAHEVSLNNPASVHFNGHVFSAKVAQINHSLDEITRTTGIRLLVENENDALHPGLFVNTQIETSNHAKALTVPEAAVLRSPDGDWQVLVEQEKAGEFKGVEIELVRVTDGRAIIKGIKPGTNVVVEGAFFVQSELAKSGFEIHNH
ncbi:Probable Co/Zn/Cd efflux system membrane fusion protein [hydrothermal vent metagenome]|uniref:Probable Co/Zn/Cd efflux system membrane fusion protein n=1 Tax=hydrothermal vent metagenome TaxID=652676 RepID=A0A3B0X7M5_9ZZZZ